MRTPNRWLRNTWDVGRFTAAILRGSMMRIYIATDDWWWDKKHAEKFSLPVRTWKKCFRDAREYETAYIPEDLR